jgi:hypothetical protein
MEATPEIRLYHASSLRVKCGDTLGPYAETKFFSRRSDNSEYKAAEAAFERLRPRHAPSRTSCVFAFDAPEKCNEFWLGEGSQGSDQESYAGQPSLYEVQADAPLRAPMNLVDWVVRLMRKGRPYEEAIREYWQSTMEWSVWEYLAPTFRVIKLVQSSELDDVAGYAVLSVLNQDGELARERWPIDIGSSSPQT